MKEIQYRSKILILKNNIMWLGLITLVFVLSIIHSFYGLEITDEPYFLALCDSIWKGTKPFTDIWAMHQTSALLLLPLVGIWHLINNGTDGIMITFRILFAFVQFCTALYTYCQLKKTFNCKGIYACFVSLFCQMTTVLGLQVLNYNALALFFGQLCFIQLIVLNKEITKLRIFILGANAAFLVQCYPSMVLVYIFILIYILSLLTHNKKTYIIKDILLFFGGSLTVLIIFFTTLFFCGVTPMDVFNNIPYILSPDRNENSVTTNRVVELFMEFKRYAQNIGIALLCISAVIAICLRTLNLKKRKNIKIILTILFFICAITFSAYWSLSVLNNLTSHPRINYGPPFIIWGNTILLLFCLIADNKKSPVSIKKSMIIFSVLFWIAMHFTTDGGIRMSAVGFVFLMEYCIIKYSNKHSDIVPEKKRLKLLFYNLFTTTSCLKLLSFIIITVSLTALGGSRLRGHYRENDLRDLNTQIISGPAAGIITTQINAENYYAMLDTVNKACVDSNTLAIEIYYPLAYLSQNCKMHAYTTGRISISSERLDLWYQLHNNELPDTVIVYKNDYNQWQWYDDNDRGGYLGTAISSEAFKKTEVPCADIYTLIKE